MNSLTLGFFLSLRTIAYGIGFALTALLFYFTGHNDFFIKASPWWPVYGLLANYICFVVVNKALKKENVRFFSLVGYNAGKIWKDIRLSLAFILCSMILAVAPAFAFGYLMYGRYPYELVPSFSSIPMLVVIVFLVVSPVVNSAIEEITYNGFIFPRLEAKVKSKAITVSWVLFFFTLQHVFITFAPDLKYMVWRLLSFVPLLLFWIIVYSRMRRLTTLIIVHWFMDAFALLSILLTPQ